MDEELDQHYPDLSQFDRMRPLNELRYRPNSAEDARDKLERAHDEVKRALDELRTLQPEYDAKDRVSSEIKSAITACMDVEKTLITAVHRVENLIHRVRKLSGGDVSEAVEKKRTGKIKWYRDDGTGYLIPDDEPEKTILIHRSSVNGDDSQLDRGVSVTFTSRDILGREVATNVWMD